MKKIGNITTKYLLFISVFFVLNACYKRAEIDIPKNKLSEKQMVELLTSIHITDAVIGEKGVGSESRIIEKSYYNAIYKKFNIDRKDFVANMEYYTSLNKIDEIYNQVVANLTNLEAKYNTNVNEKTE